MPRGSRAASSSSSSTSGVVGALTSASISTLLPPALQFVPSTTPPNPRRRLPKRIPIIDSTRSDASTGPSRKGCPKETEATSPSLEPSNPTKKNSGGSSSSSSSSLRTGLKEISAKVRRPNLPIVRAGATFLSTLSTSVALSASLHPPSNPSSAPPSPCLVPIGARPKHSNNYSTSSASSHGSVSSSRSNSSVSTVATASSLLLAAESYTDSGKMSSKEEEPADAAAPTTLPSLDFVAATDEDERIAGLKLVADSIAQRRQLASYALMTHPYFLGIMGVAFASVYSYMYKSPGDAPLIFTTCVGVLMTGLITIRAAVKPYLELAESVNQEWLGDSEVVVARWGDGADRKIIGSLVYSVEKPDGAKGSGSKKGKKAVVVRAWTTRLRERGKGVGKGLIEETVKLAKARGIDDIRWQEENLYAKRVLPRWANGGFVEGLKACRRKMEDYVAEFSRR